MENKLLITEFEIPTNFALYLSYEYYEIGLSKVFNEQYKMSQSMTNLVC